MAKIIITRSQVAQLYVELTNDNLKESFIVEGDSIVEMPEATPDEETEEVVTKVAPVPEVPPTTDVQNEATPAT